VVGGWCHEDGREREVGDVSESRDATEHDGDATVAPDDAAAAETATAPDVMELLAEHVPLALLVDLAAPDGPVSTAILESEGLPEDAWWDAPDGGAPASA
jgi:hypothetical protein